jgi:predicted ATPase/DNA-binding SARP family transcriptional activator/DNA-binding CsgD family transcriptional regulator
MTAALDNAGIHAEGDGSGSAGDEPAVLRIDLLAGFRMTVGSTELTDAALRSRQAARLIKLLALAPGHALHREQLDEVLWPGSAPAAAANSLRQALYIARRALRVLPLDPTLVLRTQHECVHLYPASRLRIDVEAFEMAARAARQAADPTDYWAAIDRYSGPLLPDDPYEDWATSRREVLAAAYLALLDDVAQLHEIRGEYNQAIAALRRLVTAEPAHEAAQGRLMRLYAASRRRPLALRQYHQLVQALARELDVAPEPATQALYQEIKRDHVPSPSREDERATTAVPAARPLTNLPHPLTTFIGRRQEVADVVRRLAGHRLVTLTGPGGTGKTRLALEVARLQVDDYPDGVWLAELGTLTDSMLLPRVIAGVLGVPIEGRGQPVDVLAAELREASLLLVLDNCEHLIGACARLVATLLRACPHVRILATSREALRLPGECSLPVPALPLPVPEAGFAAVSANDAVRLFSDRVRWHRAEFALTTDNAGDVAAICRRLDGLPLALELAAARTEVLTLPQLAARLDDALGILTGGNRAASTRQQTLRATLDWSHALLSEAEQTLFRRLAVFRGGWTLETAEAICSGGQGDRGAGAQEIGGLFPRSPVPLSPSVLDGLAALAAKSLVQVDVTGGEAWYRLLEPIRQYAADRLAASGEADDLRRRHAAHFVDFLEAIEPALSGPEQAACFAGLDREHDNLRAALGWAIDRGDAETALRLGGVLWRYWGLRWHSAEGLAWLETTLALPTATRSPLRARAALGAGELARRLVDFPRARTLLEESLEISRAGGDAAGIAWALAYLANLLGMTGDAAASRSYARESLALFRTLGDKLGMARTLNVLAEDARLTGDYALASHYYTEALALDRATGDQQGIAIRLHNLGYIALHEGDTAHAVRSFRESFTLNQALGYRTGPLSFLEGMAAAASAADRPRDAARLYGAWIAACVPPGTEFKLHAPDQAEYDRYVARARAAIGETAFSQAWEQGKIVPLEQAVAEALALADAMAGHGPAETALVDPLTEREHEVACRVARGLTNHQIADELGLAERTVDTHVGHILRKLRVATRRQVGDRLAARDFAPPAPRHT